MINCIIVEDEPLAVTLLENHISKFETTLKVVGKAANAMEAYHLLQTKNVDLMFLDIQMPHLNGIDFLKSLHHKPNTIFTTAYRDFAIEGFELEAVDYLLKPITFNRFFKAIERVLRNTNINSVNDFIIIKTEGMHRKLLLSEIIYFESQGNDIKIVLVNSESLISKSKITELESLLSTKGFIRIHRSFMINSHYITAFNNNEVMLGSHHISVGRSFKSEFDSFIKGVSNRSINR
ncbi:LytTR family DNA-binding domain-containing protein [Chryseobacterium sp. ERMR1:04]|uniref:LytR/AlgR family response regulator transcription factor n=1 Tax=Chryseobacterium sp. ERMR1:04 TaxID=1705393 RepID=UPI0006C897D3|nr:LytTR family DNA-binding domain-containing protein [Chryseobacterium sp. ERMR1:04]KPH15081.1 chemotaxis protein CheY [Chryseobacterium sp. ERMR1:04]